MSLYCNFVSSSFSYHKKNDGYHFQHKYRIDKLYHHNIVCFYTIKSIKFKFIFELWNVSARFNAIAPPLFFSPFLEVCGLDLLHPAQTRNHHTYFSFSAIQNPLELVDKKPHILTRSVIIKKKLP